jgi:hypothetical protein
MSEGLGSNSDISLQFLARMIRLIKEDTFDIYEACHMRDCDLAKTHTASLIKTLDACLAEIAIERGRK